MRKILSLVFIFVLLAMPVFAAIPVQTAQAACSCSTAYAGWYIQRAAGGLSISSGHGASTASGNTKLGEIPAGAIIYITKAQGYSGKGNSSGKYGHVTYVGTSGYVSMNLLERVDFYMLKLDPTGGDLSRIVFQLWDNLRDNHDLSAYIPTRPGYIFKGWYTAPSGGVQVYGANGVCTNEGTYWKNDAYVYGADITLYAQWTPDTVFATGITISSDYESLTEGDTLYLTATVLPSNTTNRTVKWTSSDESVATVEAGMITAVGMGVAVITASTTDGSELSASCNVSVAPYVENFDVLPYDLVMPTSGIGSQVKLTLILEPEYLKDYITWASDSPAVTVDENGVLTAHSAAEGTIIYCLIENGDIYGRVVNTTEDMSLMTLPENLLHIEAEAFDNASPERVQIPDGCLSIGSRAFSDCHGLRFVAIPDSVTFIAEDAFEGCDKLMILCGEGSEAEHFAQEHEICYTVL